MLPQKQKYNLQIKIKGINERYIMITFKTPKNSEEFLF